jgi:glycosyltransferase involved in cell wall biosynthesis
MACGLPVVAAAGGAHDETVGAAVPELLFPAGDVAACAALLSRLAGDVALRRVLGTRLRAHQQAQLGIAGHVDRLLELYAEVMRR